MGVARRASVVLGLAVISLLPSGVAWGQPLPFPFPIPIPTPGPTPTPSAPPTVDFPPFDPALCVGKPQHLLVLDMKSGWWSNDGAEFHNLLLPRVVKDCPAIDIEYYFLQHVDGVPQVPGLPIVVNGITGLVSFYPLRTGINNDAFFDQSKFPTRPWNEYQQIWLLSGSNLDPTDVPTDHEFFQRIRTQLSTMTPATGQLLPSLFLGSGIGNRDHANEFLTALQQPPLCQTHLEDIDTPSVGDGSVVETRTRVRLGTELTPHPVFDGVESIADTVAIAATDYFTDFLPVANNPFTVVGRNVRGEPAIAVLDSPARRIVLDPGMQRYYSMFKPEEVGTYRYLQNIIKFLAR